MHSSIGFYRQSSIPVTPPRSLGPDPQRSVASTVSDTPRSAKGDLGAVDQHKIRSDIVASQMAPELLRCTIDVFLRRYAPFNPENDLVDRVFAALKSKNHLTQEGNWHAGILSGLVKPPATAPSKKSAKSSTKTPNKKKRESEAAIFSKLTQVVKDMVPQDVNEDNSSPTRRFFYTDCGSKIIEGEIVGGSFKSDAFILRKEYTNGKITLSDAAVAAEFKKERNSKSIRDNCLKVIGAANHIMNDDSCRMWTYGITIEREMMSVWYFSRSHSVKSAEFDWIKDPEMFIRVFVSFLFATESKIGFDPSIRRVMHKEKWQYIYKLETSSGEKRYYRTIKSIFNPRVACITGRKTRVWKAEEIRLQDESFDSAESLENAEVIDEGRTVALKDVWLDKGSSTEREIQSAIYEKLEKVQEKDYEWADDKVLRPLIKAALEDFPRNLPFMSIECDGWGMETVERRPDETTPDPNIIPPEELESTPEQSAMRITPLSTLSCPPATNPSNHSMSAVAHYGDRHYAVKQQYRLVYSTVGYALHDAKDLSTVFKAILNACTALALLFIAGWVHRDVSTGNIIVVNVCGQVQGLLSDLEYAREFDRVSQRASDPKTGTPFFMPVEIHQGRKLRYAEEDVSEDRDILCQEEISSVNSGETSENVKAVFLFHHDLESLMWIGLWVVLGKIAGHTPSRKAFPLLFTNDSNPCPSRCDFFQGAHRKIVKSAFHPNLPPRFFSSFNIIRVELRKFCSSPELDNPTKSDFEPLINQVFDCFQKLVEDADKFNGDIKFIPPPRDLHSPAQEHLPPGDNNGQGTSIDRKKDNKGKGKVDTGNASSQSQHSSTSRKRKNSEPNCEPQRMSMRLRKRPNTD
ncbi:hypothetical protein D9756_001090 [Leucocoprinus leucothites]|uniref:Fungal-type protein kinase domain-containing protein n=1 Tax=Leucocoprinus leucothites TaxID=201217 RepID=A0A8H5LN66_9AGAR|nr:hypothetical protein D9756_001090 [Leucoagaricus leucothites]